LSATLFVPAFTLAEGMTTPNLSDPLAAPESDVTWKL
jgi:hypothetical protein